LPATKTARNTAGGKYGTTRVNYCMNCNTITVKKPEPGKTTTKKAS